MRVAVCVEQILAPEAVVLLDRAQQTGVVTTSVYTPNPTDEWAVAEALRLDSATTVGVVAVAPERAEPLLRSYLAAGADEVIRVWDPGLELADDLQRARVVASAVQHWEADLVICGSLVGDRAIRVLGPIVAEMLGIAQVTSVVRLTTDEDGLVAQRRVDGFLETVRSPLPAVVTIRRGRPLPYPTLPNRIRARTGAVATRNLADLELSSGELPAHPLEVVAISTPKPHRKVLVDDRPAMERTFDLLLGGGGGAGGGAILDGDAVDTADRVVARCLPVLTTV